MKKPTAIWSTGFAMVALVSSEARAWDEDTCSAGSETTDGVNFLSTSDPNCADPTPLQGKHPTLDFDHAVSHFEYTYLAARCLGVADTKARTIAAADAATDMSSVRCGSKLVESTLSAYKGQLYYAGYACGYEIDPNAATTTTQAVPVLNETLRWRFTDRCSTSADTSATTTTAAMHGHGEFFHYPYWETAANSQTNVVSSLRAWAFGTATTLFDPSEYSSTSSTGTQSCDLVAASGGCTYNSPLGMTEFNTSSTKVCSFANTTDASWVLPATGSTDASKRFGIYLHALGDYYSHRTCEKYAGQASNGSGEVYVPVSSAASGGPTDHTDYTTTSACGTDGVNCYDSCDLTAHDSEYGSTSDNAQIQDLRNASIEGFKDVWTQIAKFESRSTRDIDFAKSLQSTVVDAFAGNETSTGRQDVVHDYMTNNGAVAPGTTTDAQCLCPLGLYDWVATKRTRTGVGQYTTVAAHCSTVDANAAVNTAIKLSTSTTATSTAQASANVAVGGTVKILGWGQGKTLGSSTVNDIRDVGGSSDWVVSNTTKATVNNSFGSSGIGTVTGVAVGTTTLTLTRLGSTATITINVQ